MVFVYSLCIKFAFIATLLDFQSSFSVFAIIVLTSLLLLLSEGLSAGSFSSQTSKGTKCCEGLLSVILLPLSLIVLDVTPGTN